MSVVPVIMQNSLVLFQSRLGFSNHLGNVAEMKLIELF
jgi:hypothetical protein